MTQRSLVVLNASFFKFEGKLVLIFLRFCPKLNQSLFVFIKKFVLIMVNFYYVN